MKNNELEIKEEYEFFQYPKTFDQLRRKYAHDYGLFGNLERGRAILKTEEELNQYLFSYGKMHEAKLEECCKVFFDNIAIPRQKRIEIIDYACGQGLASIVCLNYLKNSSGFPIENINKITLIDPGTIAIKRASKVLENSSNLQLVNKELDELLKGDLVTGTNSIKIHLFSNILDMGNDYFNLQQLSQKISGSHRCMNYFICVSALGKTKLDFFMKSFSNYSGYKNISSFDGEFDQPWKNNPWKIVFNIFKVEF